MSVYRGKKPQILRNLNIKRVKSGDKIKSVKKWYYALTQRIEKEGQTKWLQRTMQQCMKRIKKYGVRIMS